MENYKEMVKAEMQGVSATGQLVFDRYEKLLLESIRKCGVGMPINTEELQTLNDCIRTLHHIAKLRGYVPIGE